MIHRKLWIDKINEAWKRRPIVWLSGVRRVGKTTLARMLPDAVYLNCDLPSIRRQLDDPEPFLEAQMTNGVLILDEVHRLDDPSQLLKIAADTKPKLKILATGSSTLSASHKFKDTLTGRKSEIHLTPVLWEECKGEFNINDLDKRLLHGGLPESLLAKKVDAESFAEWIDSYFARDIQELFRVRNRRGFQALFRLLIRQSGGSLNYTSLARKIDSLTRPTIISYVEAMTISHSMFLLSPFHEEGKRKL